MRQPRLTLACAVAVSLLAPRPSGAQVVGRAVPVEAPSAAGSAATGIGQGTVSSGVGVMLAAPSLGPSLSAAPIVAPIGAAGRALAAMGAAKASAAAPATPEAASRANAVAGLKAGAATAGSAITAEAGVAAQATPEAPTAAGAVAGLAAGAATRAQEVPRHAVLRTLQTLSAQRVPSALWDRSKERGELAAEPVFGTGAAERPEPQGAVLRPAAEAVPAEEATPASLREPVFDWRPAPDDRRGEVGVRPPTWSSWVKDRLDFFSKYADSFYWRVTYRTVSKWKSFKAACDARPSGVRAIDEPLSFYVRHLLIGSIGRFGIFGLRVTNDQTVLSDSWRIYDRYFKKDPAAREAFALFLGRAQSFNPHRPATQFRKVVQEALFAAATMDIQDVPGFFDILAAAQAAGSLAGYQRDHQIADLTLFNRLAKDAILEVNAHAKPGQRVLATLLMGSFASGAAGPKSDLDLQVVTEDGHVRHLEELYGRLEERWNVAGKSEHEIGSFQYALPPSRGVFDLMHRAPYLIFSPYPEVIEALQRSHADDIRVRPSDRRKWTGRVYHVFYAGILFSACLAFELKRRLIRS